MKKFILLIVLLFLSTNIFSQSWKDITAAGLDFFLKSDKARYLSNDQKTGLSILGNLLSKQGDRDFQLELTRKGRTTINVNGVSQEVKILPGSGGGLYLVTGDKVYPINGETINKIRLLSSNNQNKLPINKNQNNVDENIEKPFIDLKSPHPISSNLEFKYEGADYDYSYKNHWRITDVNGYIEVGFYGNYDFVFHSLGSTINGISYCYIDIYINNDIYISNKFIDKSWQYYRIPSNKFSSGRNDVKIVLKGDTHLWIDEIKLQ